MQHIKWEFCLKARVRIPGWGWVKAKIHPSFFSKYDHVANTIKENEAYMVVNMLP